jgi:hypothetical protein
LKYSTITQTDAFLARVTYPSYGKRDAAPAVAPRQVTAIPSSIPPYASACCGSVRYSSACSCIGVTGAVTTVPAPNTVVTVTATQPASTVTECANALPNFIIQIKNSNVVINGVDIDGIYGAYDDGDSPLLGFNGDPITDAVVVSLASNGHLTLSSPGDDGGAGDISCFRGPPNVPALILFAAAGQESIYGNSLVCQISNGILTCNGEGCCS